VNKALELYQSNLIIRCAVIEGATFANVMMYFISGSIFNIGMVLLGIAMLGLQFPFFGRVIPAIEWMIDSAKDENSLI